VNLTMTFVFESDQEAERAADWMRETFAQSAWTGQPLVTGDVVTVETRSPHDAMNLAHGVSACSWWTV
jgi:hypothetical protein